ncbi:meprin A subunit beta-like [Garra rufa]|uniref:meprin A subunit beta-like n=1 Tax=Garra rufa TaxID=137080 RepID=UPI003CCEE3E2
MNELRANGWWILGSSRAVSSYIFKCVRCRKYRRKTENQSMGDLPVDRTEPSPPFTYVGMDCFGPIYVKDGPKELKRYGLILTCLCSRAIHIEVVDDLSTDAFLNALRAFITIRGNVCQLRCDRGTNFIGAQKELADLMKEMNQEKVKALGCEFLMIPPSASHMGGVWERQIRTIHSVLSAILDQSAKRLDSTSLRTLLYEVMAIVNSRPLSIEHLSDPTGPEPLTPNHILTMKSTIVQPPPGEFMKEDLCLQKRWRRVQYLANEFWIRWRKEYLLNLQPRQKWNVHRRNLKINDVVLLQDDMEPRNEWKLAKVTDVYPGTDNKVRKVRLLVSERTYDKHNLNYKGVILRAFEQFRLKSCIDFKPRTAEDISYISVESCDGCWSYVGCTSGAQTLSIGNGCGIKGIVEHEFLHALGFWHEQSRYDRDDYVTINFENIITGLKPNFNKYSKNMSTTQDTPYDYYSLMHYDKNAFSNGNGSTIITKRPEFQDVIGQRLDMSEYDAIELNKLYKCNSSISFLDHCSFDDESLCQMSVCSAAAFGWQRVKSVSGINVTDHTYLGKEQNGMSFFMHFSTEGRNKGDVARIESKTMTPKRDCKVQCLQFYYYHSGHESDQLNIWIREYQNEADNRGTLRLMDQITGPPGNYWKLHHVPLNANKTFQVVFEARKGAGNSSGGFSLDDINISETECPHTWQIRDFEKVLNNSVSNTRMYSPLYYSSEGYRFQARLGVYQNYLSIYVRLVSGAYDDQLQWPCPWRQITFQVLDQNPHIQKRMSSEQSFTTDPTLVSSDGGNYWEDSRNNGTHVVIGDETVYVGVFWGYQYATMKDDLTRREFIKGGDIIILFTMQDISGLLQNHSLQCPKVTVKNFNVTSEASVQQGPCAPSILPTPQSFFYTSDDLYNYKNNSSNNNKKYNYTRNH